MTAVCALSLALAVWVGLQATRAAEPDVAAVGGVFAGAVSVAAVWVWRHCHASHPLARIQEKS